MFKINACYYIYIYYNSSRYDKNLAKLDTKGWKPGN